MAVLYLYRSARELQEIVATARFDESSDDPDVKRYVGLLGARAADDPALPIRSLGDGPDIVQTSRDGMHVFLLSRPVKGRYGFPKKSSSNRPTAWRRPPGTGTRS